MRQTTLDLSFTPEEPHHPRENFYRKMPAPQYLGAKYKFLPWIFDFIPEGTSTVLDGFSGSQSFAFEAKKRGYTVHTNDFLRFCHMGGFALIENKHSLLTQEDLTVLFSGNDHRDEHMIRFKDIFFVEPECILLDNFRANVEHLDCPYKRALSLTIMCRSLTRKTIMGHFAHLRAIPYARNPKRVKRNPSIARPIRDLFIELLPAYDSAVFDNGKKNQSYCENILELLPNLSANPPDLAYYDPPYCGSHADYQAFYHLLETFVERWSDKTFINRTQRYYPPRYSGFDKITDIEHSFRKLFALSHEISHWLISYNDRSLPKIETLVAMAKHHKSVRVEEKLYQNSRGGRGSVSGSREYLLVCS